MGIKIKEKTFNNRNFGFVAFVLIIAAIIGFAYIKNPNLFKLQKTDIQSQKITVLESKIAELEKKLEAYHQNIPVISKEDIIALNDKVDNLGKINTEILNSKASIASQMGLIERMDELEFRVNNLGQKSSRSALILTAASLVKEAAATGEPFVYEAAVLKELTADSAMEKSADIILSYADKGLPSQEELIDNFKQIYEQTFTITEDKFAKQENKIQEQPKNWKDKILDKLKTLIVIKKYDDSSEKRNNDEIWQLVDKGDLKTASFKMEHNKKYQTEAFEIWRQKVTVRKSFNQTLNKIQALALGKLKAENLTND